MCCHTTNRMESMENIQYIDSKYLFLYLSGDSHDYQDAWILFKIKTTFVCVLTTSREQVH